MSDPTQKETYDHLAARTIVDGVRVSELEEGAEHPEIFGQNIVEVEAIDTNAPPGFRQVARSQPGITSTTSVPATSSATSSPSSPSAGAPSAPSSPSAASGPAPGSSSVK